jgi:aspartate/methionine/tyrosine aminotransferase
MHTSSIILFTISTIMLLLPTRLASGFVSPRHRVVRNKNNLMKLFSSNNNSNVLSSRLEGLDRSTVWQEFSPLALEYNAMNLGQGFPDWNPPDFTIDAMQKATNPKYGRNANQYARSYAHMPLATVLAEEYSQRWNLQETIDPATQIATGSGVTNVLYCALQGLLEPGDEVLLMEPAFDIYSSQVKMAGGSCVYCPLRPDFSKDGASAVFTLDMDELRSKITSKTKVMILNSPHNPTGKMFSLEEMRQIAQIVLEHPNLIVLSDEVYEHIAFDKENEPHLSIATIDNGILWDRTLTMSSSGKTFSCTGWKVGWAVGPPHLVKAVSAVQQWVNFSSATPTQDAIAQSLVQAREPYQGFDSYYAWLAEEYNRKRGLLINALQGAGMNPIVPPGGFFIIADTSNIDFPYEEIAKQYSEAMPTSKMPRDWALSRWLTQQVGVTAIPPSAFYSPPNVPLAKDTLRFAFCKGDEIILEAGNRLQTFFSK